MLKLVRNLLQEKQCIIDGTGSVVARNYLAALYSLLQLEGIDFHHITLSAAH